MKKKRGVFDTSTEVTKKKGTRDINREPEMIELKRMIRAGELNPERFRSLKTNQAIILPYGAKTEEEE